MEVFNFPQVERQRERDSLISGFTSHSEVSRSFLLLGVCLD